MDFAYPIILYALALLPLLFGIYLLARYSRRRKLARFGRPEVVASLMPEASRYKPVIKIILELLALGALIVALARPRGGEMEETEQMEGIEVMIAVDVSRSMDAASTDDKNSVSRMQRAQYLLHELVKKLENDRVGIVVFAGNSLTRIPLTNDYSAVNMAINDLSTSLITAQGTDIGAAIDMAMDGFSGDQGVNRAIVLITDCEDNEARGEAAAAEARKEGIQVDIIGIGTERGAVIPISANAFLKDSEGKIVTTRFNPEAARRISEAGGGIYVDGSASDAVDKIDETLDAIKKADLGERRYKTSAEKFPIFIWIALALMIADIFVLDRKIGWLSRITFFSNGAAIKRVKNSPKQ